LDREPCEQGPPRPSIVKHILEGEAWSDDVVDAIKARSGDTGRDIER
jgi:hypothetical protein